MTDPLKISRELRPLLERVDTLLENLGALNWMAAHELRVLLAQPSEPQGGEEVEVVAWLSPSTVEAVIPGAGHDVLAGEGRELIELMTVAQHRRLMAEQLERADGIADLCRFLAKLYCELDELRYPTAKLPPEQIAEHMLFRWPVLQGTRNQISIKRISEQPYDQEALHAGIAAMLVRAQEKNHGK